MPQHRRYSREQKARAVGEAMSLGVTQAGEKLGIPKTTIQYWTEDPEFAQLRTRARDEVASEMWAAIQVGLRAVVEGLRDPDAPLRDKATALGTLYDRHALLTGGATARTESRDLADLSDADLVSAVREAQSIVGG